MCRLATCAIAALLLGRPAAAAQPQGETTSITKEVVVPATRAEVWRAWTTDEGVRTFLAPSSNVKLAIGGPYEIFFAPDAPPGQRGGEDLKVLSYLPMEMLSFDWSFPPSIPSLREAGARTWVVVTLADAGPGQVRVRLTQLGWQSGGDWDKSYNYFQHAWDIVLGRLEKRFASGPIDWNAP